MSFFETPRIEAGHPDFNAVITNMTNEIVEIINTDRDEFTLEAAASTIADMEALIMITDELRSLLHGFAAHELTHARSRIDRVITRLDTLSDEVVRTAPVFKP